jgi:2-keto-3-deoxy-L-rhamnonate aldolase RhmA
MLKNTVKERMKQGKASVGLISNLASHHLTEIFGIAGFDYIIFDLEHSTISEETLEGLVRTAKLKGLIPMARVRENNARLVLGVLDAGCLGVMIPQVESKEEAQEAVESTKYRPLGKRGINWKTVAGEWGALEPAEYIKAANENILTLIQIETVKGFENVEEIVKVEGIDAIMTGPSDLSASMGYPGNPEHEDVKKAIGKIISVAKDAGIASGGAASANKEMMAKAQNNGVLLFTVNPAAFITESCKQLLSGIKDTFI